MPIDKTMWHVTLWPGFHAHEPGLCERCGVKYTTTPEKEKKPVLCDTCRAAVAQDLPQEG